MLAGWLTVVGLVTAGLAAPALGAPDPQLQVPGDPRIATLISTEQALLDLTNADRAANGLPALELDAAALHVARERAASQLGSTPLSHYDADGQLAFARLLQAAELGYQLAGENLARSSEAPDTPGRVESALMQSPLHRKNILEQRFTTLAIGAAEDGNGVISFAEIFRGD
jgi:uncharacterized protein YkwD